MLLPSSTVALASRFQVMIMVVVGCKVLPPNTLDSSPERDPHEPHDMHCTGRCRYAESGTQPAVPRDPVTKEGKASLLLSRNAGPPAHLWKMSKSTIVKGRIAQKRRVFLALMSVAGFHLNFKAT